MAKFFRYKTLEQLLGAAAALGVSMEGRSDWSSLSRGIEVGGRRVGNRLAIQPMEGCDGTSDGAPGELTFRRYARFGAGGAKLIWGEAAAVLPEGRANRRQLLAIAAHERGLGKMVEVCRAAHRAAWGDDSDLLIGLQLTHSGRYSAIRPRIAQHDSAFDGRTNVGRGTGKVVGAGYPLLTDDELARLQDCYVNSAGVAYRAGFDFVDLKQCHRYLLNELLSARTRPGRYGGAYGNRTRFIRELVVRLRAEVPGLLLATRMNVFDGVPFERGEDGIGRPVAHEIPLRSAWGAREESPMVADLAEPARLVGELALDGVSIFNVTMGNPYASPHIVRPFDYAPVDGYLPPEHPLVGVGRHLALASEIRRMNAGVVVVGSGYSWLQAFFPHVAAAEVGAGRVSFAGVGRGSLSNPDFAREVLEGRALDRRKTCRTFSYCTALMRAKDHPMGQYPTGCPPFDGEVYGGIWDEARGGGGAVDGATGADGDATAD
jgi:2,4-dienoyl-CoA reductase-like NADH-dependent reductase (Old Yellow Enzyme family)